MGGDTFTSEPLVVASADSARWDESADVLVVGFGGAGAAAALQATEDGASVLAIDRFAGGGATAYSGGVIYAGATRHQRESGIEDSPNEMFKYLAAEGSAVGPDTLRRFCEGSSADMDWLEAHGVPHGANAFLEKTNFPPDGHWIYYSGNEKVYAHAAKPAPRGHRTAVTGFGGHAHFAKLRESALAKGIRLVTHAPVTRLIVDGAGEVVGVEANVLPESAWTEHQALYSVVSPWRPFNAKRAEKAIVKARQLERLGEARRFRAKRGVILAGGGFIYNLEVLAKYRPELAKNYRNLLRLGSMGDDGSGIALGQSVGGGIDLMENVCVARTIAPPNEFPHGLIVNELGERFVNEGAYAFIVGGKVAEQPSGGRAWLLLEAESFWTAVKQSVFPGKGLFLLWGAPALINLVFGGTGRARTLTKLAKKCRIDPQALERTIAAHNTLVEKQEPDPFGKVSDLMYPLKDGPFYAVNLSLDNMWSPAQTFTLGGLTVQEQTGLVTRSDGSAIERLYAAGRVAVGLCSKGYMSGMSIADTVFSGRRAGHSAAAGETAQVVQRKIAN